MKRRIVCLLFGVTCSLLVLPAWGQSLPSSGKTEIFLPKVIRKSGSGVSSLTLLKEKDAEAIAKDSKFGQKPANKQASYWVVYSDRDDNAAYKTSSGKDVNTYLSFNQRVIIADIDYKSRRALVYEDKKAGREWPSLPTNPMEYTVFGWVSMDNLLLWDTCPVDEQGIYNKALLSLNLDAESKVDEKEAEKMYRNPDSSVSMNLSLDEKIYYIMKRKGDKVLLANQYTLVGGYTYMVLHGWVKGISYVAWNQRSCLEPTWVEDDVLFFSKNGVRADVTSGVNSAQRSTSWDFQKSKSMQKPNNEHYNNNPKDPYRVPGDFRRFPILGRDKKTGKYKVTSFSKSASGNSTMDVDFTSWGRTEEELSKLLNINLVILIDGTKSMESFYEPVRKGIEEGCQNLSLISKSRIKVGAVIYRDAKDIQGGKSYEVEKLVRMVSPGDATLADFLKKGGEYGVRSSSADKTMEESLYKGMETAMEYFRGKEKESNILLVIGDCGNVQNDAQRDQLVKTLVKGNVQLMGYQVRMRNSKSFGAFVDQMFYLVSESIKGIYAGQNKSADYVRFRLSGNSYAMTAPKEEARSHQGSVISPLDGSTMKSKELSDYMFSSISKAQEAIQHQLDVLVRAGYGDFEADPDYLRARGIDPGTLRNKVSFQGWTMKTDASSGRDFYKSVLFLSAAEFETLKAELGKVPTGGHNTAAADRLSYVNAMKEVAARHVGQSGQDISKMSQRDLNALIYGLNEKSDALGSKFTMEDILQPQKVSDRQFNDLLEKFRKKYKKLCNINEDYQGYYEFNGAKYYWIPIEDLP